METIGTKKALRHSELARLPDGQVEEQEGFQ